MSDETEVSTPTTEEVEQQTATKPKRKAAARKRPANASSVKGGKWERDIAKTLSLWITRNERGDIFRRSITSGGRFTSQTAKGKDGGHPGDIAISHPLGASFVSEFCIEAKHHKDINLSAYILSVGTPFLSKVVTKVREEAKAADIDWIAIIKQDKRPAFMLMDEAIGMIAKRHAVVPLEYHLLFNHKEIVFVCRLDAFVASVNPNSFIRTVAGEVPSESPHTPPVAIKRRPISAPPAQPPPAKIQRRPLHA